MPQLKLCTLICIVSLAATQSCQQAIDSKPPPLALTTMQASAWDCDRTGYVVASPGKEQDLWIFLPGKTSHLYASAAKNSLDFGSTELGISFNDDTATISIDGNTESCRKNRHASIWEDAKLRGVDFRAVGNEPPWQLEIGPNTIELKTGYDLSAQAFPMTKPTGTGHQTTQYQTHTNKQHLVILISGNFCSDSMSGENFASTVVVHFNDQELTGCGRPLH